MRVHVATFLDDFRRHGNQIAVVQHRGVRRVRTSYGEIARLAGRFAAYLVQRGIQPGERVLLWAENSAEWIAAFHGCILRGVLVVPLDATGSADFARRACADVHPALAVGDSVLLDQLIDGQNELARMAFEQWDAVLPEEEAGAIPGISHDTPLQILFTSGTTGVPKGIVHTHGNILASVSPIEDGAQRYLRYKWLVHPLRFLHTLPLSHVFGQMMGLWMPPIFAAQVHFENRLAAPRLVELVRRERISVLSAVPRLLALLKSHLESERAELQQRIRAVQGISAWKRWWRFRDVHSEFGFKFWALISGGGALPPAVEKFWSSLGFVVIQGYGMTETTALVTLNHPFHVQKGSIGKALPGREVQLSADGELLVRGPMISNATWSNGALQQRDDAWLATGDLVERQSSGEFRFLGRKSEVIVTASGVNLHPEDLEPVIEQESGVQACAVVAIETANGPEPCAVLAFRGTDEQAAEVIRRANGRLAEYQKISRWMLWPEPDLPRTSTGKVKRKAVATWLTDTQTATSDEKQAVVEAAPTDWLLKLIVQLTAEPLISTSDETRLSEDLHLDSLGRVQLAEAIEQRTGLTTNDDAFDGLQTLGELRHWLSMPTPVETVMHGAETGSSEPEPTAAPTASLSEAKTEINFTLPKYVYPHWPWWPIISWLRTAFVEAVLRPLVWLLAKPRIVTPKNLAAEKPMLIVANHASTYDGPLLQYALPGAMRNRMAVAMSGEMLDDFRHFRNPERRGAKMNFYPPGPLAYVLLTALFNVFPLPRQRNFQRSFAHAGEALDQGLNVLVFPEGRRSADGALAQFRPGIGLLVKESGAPVLPVAIRGLGELKLRRNRWFRSGTIEIHVGEPVYFSPEDTETAITARLYAEVKGLLDKSEV